MPRAARARAEWPAAGQ